MGVPSGWLGRIGPDAGMRIIFERTPPGTLRIELRRADSPSGGFAIFRRRAGYPARTLWREFSIAAGNRADDRATTLGNARSVDGFGWIRFGPRVSPRGWTPGREKGSRELHTVLGIQLKGRGGSGTIRYGRVLARWERIVARGNRR